MSADGAAPAVETCERPILRERGQREVFCGLTGIEAAPSHLASVSAAAPGEAAPDVEAKASSASQPGQPAQLVWGADAEAELRKIPFFVRGKAKRNTERFATEHGISKITVETLYDAKAHFSR
jgi:light-independent protochlorophyllide reductase subunit B